jgi:hypothetical protein
MDNKVAEPEVLRAELETLKSVGTDGVMVDCSWVPPLVRHDPRRQAQVAGIVKPPLPLTISRNPKLFLRMLTKQVIPFRW